MVVAGAMEDGMERAAQLGEPDDQSPARQGNAWGGLGDEEVVHPRPLMTSCPNPLQRPLSMSFRNRS